MEKFLSCDWGTSSFRLRLADANSFQIIASQNSSQGIAQTFALWQQSNLPDEKRILFYRNYIEEQIKIMEQKLNISLDHLPVALSGMASSNMGMLELPYKKLPFDIDGSDLLTEYMHATEQFQHDILLISGACTNDDVIRGEETQLVGAGHSGGKTIYIFPGTHSKHLFVEELNAVDCKTYMTGEFFELLSGKSILAASVQEGNGFDYADNIKSFEKGVGDGIEYNLLNSSFRVRTNILFSKMSKQENYHYLSGLLIGSELKELTDTEYDHITVVSNRVQSAYYGEALRYINKDGKIPAVSFIDVEEATVKGQLMIYNSIPGNSC